MPAPAPGDIAVMDDLPARGGAGMRTAVQAAGASAVPPAALQPGRRPIEQAFSTLEAILRRAAARTIPGRCTAVAIPPFKPRERADSFQAAGWEPV